MKSRYTFICKTMSHELNLLYFVVIFDLLNIYSGETLSHDEIFRLYKLFYSSAISDDHILALTFKALNHNDLETKGQITFQEFEKVSNYSLLYRKSGIFHGVDIFADMTLTACITSGKISFLHTKI